MTKLCLQDIIETNKEGFIDTLLQQDYQVNQTLLNNKAYCPRIYDNYHCWPQARTNTTVRLPCPGTHFGEFVAVSSDQYVSKYCDIEGYYMKSNFSLCEIGVDELETVYFRHSINDQLIYNIIMIKLRVILIFSSCLSIISCIIGIYLYTSNRFKNLKCQRTEIHSNLFASFLLYHLNCLLKVLMTAYFEPEHFSLHRIPKTATGYTEYIENMSRKIENNSCPKIEKFQNQQRFFDCYFCKIINIIFWYSHLSSQLWMLNEGLFLRSQILRSSKMLENKNIKMRYFLFIGWVLPCFLTIPMTVLTELRISGLLDRLYDAVQKGFITEAEYIDKATSITCYDQHANPHDKFFVILPVMGCLLINTTIIVHIIYVIAKLSSKENEKQPEEILYSGSSILRHRQSLNSHTKLKSKSNRKIIKKTLKSTAMLIPLLGVTEFLIIWNPWHEMKNAQDAIHISLSAFLRSLEGLLITTLFCFLTKDVLQNYKRWKYRKDSVTSMDYQAVLQERRYSQLTGRKCKIRKNGSFCWEDYDGMLSGGYDPGNLPRSRVA